MSNESYPTPVGNRIIIRPDQISRITSGGMIMPGSYKQKELHGTVLTSNSPNVDKGERVLYYESHGEEIPLNGTIYLVFHESAVTIIPQ
jgi:co-chaperonin GroES (HSP10)